MVNRGGGACVVVRTRESRVHGEGRQGTDRVAKTEEPPMDLGDQADQAWLLSLQRKLYQWSRTHPEQLPRLVELDYRPPQSAVRLAENRSEQRASYCRGRRDDSSGNQSGDGYGVVPGTATWRPEEWPVQAESLTTQADPQAAATGEVPTPPHPHPTRS